MKPIKFRGKAIHGGDLVYGDLVHDSNGNRLLIYNPEIKKSRLIYPESVTQLVGYDVNGKEVYEGDVVTDSQGKPFLVKTISIAACESLDYACTFESIDVQKAGFKLNGGTENAEN